MSGLKKDILLEKTAILVNTCDDYEDAWEPFFRLLKIQWPECNFHIYLNTEYKEYKSDLFNITVIKTGKAKWSKRVKNAIKQIPNDYILFFLEDFFLISRTNNKKFLDIAQNIFRDDVGLITFAPDIDYMLWNYCELENNLIDIEKSSTYRINANVGLWKKSFFISLLRSRESAWEFEINASRRAKRTKYRVFGIKSEGSPVFDYHINPKYGYGISRRKWLPNNVELFKKYSIDVNFENLGLFNLDEWKTNQKREKRHHRSKRELILLSFKHPLEFAYIVMSKIKSLVTYLISYI